jgi:hypothetical protein
LGAKFVELGQGLLATVLEELDLVLVLGHLGCGGTDFLKRFLLFVQLLS